MMDELSQREIEEAAAVLPWTSQSRLMSACVASRRCSAQAATPRPGSWLRRWVNPDRR